MKNPGNISLVILLVVWLLTLESCFFDENDLESQNCAESCASINGVLMTGDGTAPLADAFLEVTWDNTSLFGGTNRLKAQTTSEENGYYELNFLVREDELSDGLFNIRITPPEEYLMCFFDEIYSFSVAGLKNDTVVTTNFGIPKKAYLIVNSVGTEKIDSTDFLIASTFSPMGVNFESRCVESVKWDKEDPIFQDTLEVAAEIPLAVETITKYGGIKSRHTDTLTLEKGEVMRYTAEF